MRCILLSKPELQMPLVSMSLTVKDLLLALLISEKEFKYHGSIFHHSLTSDADVDKHMKNATATFGELKNIFTKASC